MARSDYAHWNEDADRVWWQEEGRHETYEEPYDEDGDWGWNDADDDWDEDEDEDGEPEADCREDFGWAGMTE